MICNLFILWIGRYGVSNATVIDAVLLGWGNIKIVKNNGRGGSRGWSRTINNGFGAGRSAGKRKTGEFSAGRGIINTPPVVAAAVVVISRVGAW